MTPRASKSTLGACGRRNPIAFEVRPRGGSGLPAASVGSHVPPAEGEDEFDLTGGLFETLGDLDGGEALI